MKPCTLSIFSLLIIFISISSATNTAVVDIDGHKLQAGVNYYILPYMRGNGGGLALTSRNESVPCPLTVSQENQEVSRGLPVQFYPANSYSKLITVSTDLNIEFKAMTFCLTSTVWKLGSLNEETGQRYVGISGQKGNPGGQTLSNWFKIEKVDGDNVYKMVFCPTVCNFCKVICGDLGIFMENEKRFLGLKNDKPLRVFFKRAD